MLDVDYVFHLAALGSVPRSINNPLATHGVNLSGFLNVLIAAREAKVKRIVYSSSSSVYGDNVDSPKKEEITGTPLSPYAVTKKGNELYASVFVKNYGMEIIGLRYFNIFGPRQDPHGAYAAVLPLFMHAIIRNEPPFINGDGTQSRDFTYIENAVQGNIKSMFTTNRDAIGGIFNIAIGENYSINQLIH